MFTGQTTIGRIVARVPARTEALHARMRLSHLLQSADLAPPGFPPQAVLVIRRAAAPRRVSLGAFHLRPDWEREMRAEVALLWRRAVRPARGHVPADAEAVWFADVSEWLAALGLAIERREIERHWCWRASLGAGLTGSASPTLARAWAETPRLVPAAVVRLVEWGEAARVLRVLTPGEAGALLSTLSSEFDLPRVAASGIRPPIPWRDAASEHDLVAAAADGASADEDAGHDATTRVLDGAGSAPGPPWKRWLPTTDSACERLPATTQQLLAFAVAVFHAPAHARSRGFAAEVAALVEINEGAQRQPVAPSRTSRLAVRARTRGDRRLRETRDAASDFAGAHDATGDDVNPTRFERDASPLAPSPRETRDAARVEEFVAPPFSTRRLPDDSLDEELANSSPFIEEDEAEISPVAPWRDLEGRETALGGVLFLLNFFIHLRLPECLDEDFSLSEHITGWGLAELLGRELLNDVDGAYDADPLWRVLARLDGRREGEQLAAGLRVGNTYRAPARWLKLHGAHDAAWSFHVSDGLLMLRHAGGFLAAVQPLAGVAPARAAARVVDEYRARGVRFAGLDDSAGIEDARLISRVGAARRRQAFRAQALAYPSQQQPKGWTQNVSRRELSFSSTARAPISQDLRRWMSWTFPFLKYVLARALADEEVPADGELVRTLLVKRGRLYATATHVDLVMEMSEVSFPVRRAGLDASPGWVRDLMRVVKFHYE